MTKSARGDDAMSDITSNFSEAETEDSPRTFCVKFMLIVSAIGFFLGGIFCLASTDAAIVDFFYTAQPQWGADVTVTLFLDGLVCNDGDCWSMLDGNDKYVCDAMKATFVEFQRDSIALGTMMICAFLLTTSSIYMRSVESLTDFVAWKLCQKRLRTRNSCSPQCRSWTSKISLCSGIILQFVILVFAILMLYRIDRMCYYPLCEQGTSVVYNQSLELLVGDTRRFSYGRGLNLNFYASIIVITADSWFFLWFVITCCHRFWCDVPDDDDDDDNDDETDANETHIDASSAQDYKNAEM